VHDLHRILYRTRPLTSEELLELRRRYGLWPPLAGGDKDDDDKGKKDDDDKGGKGGGGGGGSSEDEPVSRSEFKQLQAALREARDENKTLKDRVDSKETQAQKDAGKWEELYNNEVKAHGETKTQLEGEKDGRKKDNRRQLVLEAATRLKFRTPAFAPKLVDLDKIEDDADAERALNKLIEQDKTLVGEEGTRQRAGAGEGGSSGEGGGGSGGGGSSENGSGGSGGEGGGSGGSSGEGEAVGPARLRSAYATKETDKGKSDT